MADWQKEVATTVTIPEGALDKRVTFYYSDVAAAPPNAPRITITGRDSTGAPFSFDGALADLSVTQEQLAALVGVNDMAIAQMLALHGFSS